jgi:hypothetical protein
MRTATGSALLLAFAALCAAPAARAADTRSVLSALVDSVEVRFGVAHDSLVVLPIVLSAAPQDAAAAASVAGADVSWHCVPSSETLVELTVAAGGAPKERLLPFGTLLEGDVRERLLSRTTPLMDTEHAIVTSQVCDSRKDPGKPDAVAHPGPVAPVEQRKLQMLGVKDSLFGILQQIQSSVAGLPPGTETVAAVLAAPKVKDGVAARWADLSKIPGAYAGLTVGHVAFFGFRPVEVVLFATPAEYQAFGPGSLRALAASHTMWCEVVDAALPATDAEVRRLIPEGAAVVKSLARVRGDEVKARVGERFRWKVFTGAAETDVRAGGHAETLACRFCLDEAGRLREFEAIENGPEVLYPQPYREPGGRPVGEHPDNKGNGPLTPAAMERILERIIEHRAERSGGR